MPFKRKKPETIRPIRVALEGPEDDVYVSLEDVIHTLTKTAEGYDKRDPFTAAALRAYRQQITAAYFVKPPTGPRFD